MSSYEQTLSLIFETALRQFRDTLSEEDRDAFQVYDSSTAMIREIGLSCNNYLEKGKLLSCCKKIASFAKAFEPYFEIVGIFVQIKPDWLGWFWGTIRFVFKLGCNYSTFLEKVSEMFESMSFILPQYERHLAACAKRRSNSNSNQLVECMSFLYADIIQFCQEISCMFSRSTKGSKLKYQMRFLKDIIWKPFNLRFSHLEERIRKHQSWFDREMTISDQQLLTEHYEEFIDYVSTSQKVTERQRYAEIGHQQRIAAQQVDQIKTWLNSPDYRRIYEKSVNQRHPRTGDWLFSRPLYEEWRNKTFGTRSNSTILGDDWHHRILSLQAKPGYGKTFLSSVIIEKLDFEVDDLVPRGEPLPTTVFYHFGLANNGQGNNSGDGFRAIATQLVHAHRNEPITIDTLALLIDKVSGQRYASDDDTDAILKVLLAQYAVFIVIDGVDECADSNVLLAKVHMLAQISDCRILLLSRPNIYFPRCFGQRARIIQLMDDFNLPDIRKFLDENLSIMVSEGLFGGLQIEDDTFVDIASRAKGMFLWARLLINFLSSPALSARERHNTLRDANLLEGLDGLYQGILDMLSKKYSREKKVASDIFKWLSESLYPLNTDALRVALAIAPGEPTDELQYLNNFAESVPKITCALVEVDSAGIPNFIHLSLKEYLETRESLNTNPEFSLRDKREVHKTLAVRCLSYLANDFPKKPLGPLISPHANDHFSRESGANSLEATTEEANNLSEVSKRDLLDRKYPLLRYATLCWVEHLFRGLSPEPDASHAMQISRPEDTKLVSPNANSQHPFSEWTPVLSQFLVDRRVVTLWVEACCSYLLSPNVSRLVPLVEKLRQGHQTQSLAGRELWWVCLGIQQLAAALDDLRAKHIVALKENPTLIWQREISSATDSSFWPCFNADINAARDPGSLVPRSGAAFRPGDPMLRSSVSHNLDHLEQYII